MKKRKKLAIKGHETRGKEVIQILEMLGGNNKYNMEVNQGFGFSYIINNNDDNNIECRCVSTDEFKIFTLEEFLEKFPYKKRQQVVVSDGLLEGIEVGEIFKIRWTGKTIKYTIVIDNDYYECTANELNRWNKYEEKQESQCDNCSFFGSWKCIEYGDKCNNGKIIKNSEMNTNDNNVDLTLKISQCYVLPDGFHFADENGNVIDSTKILLVKNSPSYPTTYEKCCEMIGIEEDLWFTYEDIDANHINPACISNYRMRRLDLYHNFEKLIICRDAYWKIAGEQMGLGKPWEPAIQDSIWGITRSKDEVEKYSCHFGKTNPLEFPTVEMRDAFYDNFKDLIELCKELL